VEQVEQNLTYLAQHKTKKNKNTLTKAQYALKVIMIFL